MWVWKEKVTMSFTSFLSQSKSTLIASSLQHFEELLCALSFVYRFIDDRIYVSTISQIIDQIPTHLANRKPIILSNGQVSKSFFSLLSDAEKNITISFFITLNDNVRTYFDNQHKKNIDSASRFHHIIEYFYNQQSSIYEKVEKEIARVLNSISSQQHIFIDFEFLIKKNTYCELRVHIKNDINSDDINQYSLPSIVIINNSFVKKPISVFDFVFNASKYFDLPFLVDLLDQIDKLPSYYKDIQTFVYKYPDKFSDTSHIIYYLKKYIEEKEKYYYNQSKTTFHYMQKIKNELHIAHQLYQRFLYEFSDKYQYKTKNSLLFSNPNNIVFNRNVIQLTKHYLPFLFENEEGQQALLYIITPTKVIEIDDQFWHLVEKNYLFSEKYVNNELHFVAIGEKILPLSICIQPVFEIHMKKVKKYQHINLCVSFD